MSGAAEIELHRLNLSSDNVKLHRYRMHTASQPLLPTSAPLAADAAPLAGPSGTPR